MNNFNNATISFNRGGEIFDTIARVVRNNEDYGVLVVECIDSGERIRVNSCDKTIKVLEADPLLHSMASYDIDLINDKAGHAMTANEVNINEERRLLRGMHRAGRLDGNTGIIDYIINNPMAVRFDMVAEVLSTLVTGGALTDRDCGIVNVKARA